MNYSPVIDAAWTFGLLGALLALSAKHMFDTIHWRRAAEMLRRAGKWGGQ